MATRLLVPVLQAVFWLGVLAFYARQRWRERKRQHLATCYQRARFSLRREWARSCPHEEGRTHLGTIAGPGKRVALLPDGSVQLWARHPAEAAQIIAQAVEFHVQSTSMQEDVW